MVVIFILVLAVLVTMFLVAVSAGYVALEKDVTPAEPKTLAA